MKHERMIKCVTAHSLEWSITEERPVNRVAAIGLSMRLDPELIIGENMLRVDALDGAALRKVILLSLRRLSMRFRIQRGFGKKMVLAALHELLRQNCIHCGGIGTIHHKGAPSVTCSHCGGSGLHRYTDNDRKALIGSTYNHKAYEDVLSYLRDSTYEIVRRSEKRLGE